MNTEILRSLYDQEPRDDPQVLLRTESGRWQWSAYKKNDPIFSVLIPDLPLELIPDEIVLKRSVAEILETEWPSLLQLAETMSALSLESEVMREGPGKEVYRYAGIAVHDGNDTFTQPDVDYPRLANLLRLSKLISFPVRWQLYVSTDQDAPQQERLRHIEAVAGVLCETAPDDLTVDYERTRRYALSSLISSAEDILLFLFLAADWDRKLGLLIVAHFRNLYLLRHCHQQEVGLEDVLWEDLSVITADTHVTDELKNLLAVMQGKGKIEEVHTKFKYTTAKSSIELCTCFMQNMDERHSEEVRRMATVMLTGGASSFEVGRGFWSGWIGLPPLHFVVETVTSLRRTMIAGLTPVTHGWFEFVKDYIMENKAFGLQLCRLLLPCFPTLKLAPLHRERADYLVEWYKRETKQ